jgi:hypothetical protein
MGWVAFIAIIVSLLLIGFFAGIEIAFISANKLSIELNRKQGTKSGKVFMPTGQPVSSVLRLLASTWFLWCMACWWWICSLPSGYG